MNSRQKIGSLLSVHAAAGIAVILVNVFTDIAWPTVVEIAFAAFIASELMLLGAWIGLSSAGLGTRFGQLILGVACVTGVALIDRRMPSLSDLIEVPIVFFACSSAVSFVFILAKKLCATIDWRDHWEATSTSQDIQFSLKFLLCVITLTAVLLAFRPLMQRFGREAHLVGLAIVFPLEVVLATGGVIWAGLGNGQLKLRVPIALLLAGLVGFLLPFFFGGNDMWVWPTMSFLAGVFTLASLIVVRSAGYRMVAVRAKRMDAAAALGSPADSNIIQ